MKGREIYDETELEIKESGWTVTTAGSGLTLHLEVMLDDRTSMKKYKMMILIPERHLRMDWLIYTGDNVLYTPVQLRGLHVPSSQRGLWTQTGPVVLWEDRGGTSCLNGLRYHIWIVTWQFWGRTIPLSGDKLQEVFARLTERLKQFAVFMIVMRSGDSKGHNHSFHTQMIQWPPLCPWLLVT